MNGSNFKMTSHSKFTDETVRVPLPRLGSPVRRGDRDHHSDPHEPTADAEGVRVSGGHEDVHLLRRHHGPHHARQ